MVLDHCLGVQNDLKLVWKIWEALTQYDSPKPAVAALLFYY